MLPTHLEQIEVQGFPKKEKCLHMTDKNRGHPTKK